MDGTLETYTVVVKDGLATFSVTGLSPFAVFIKGGVVDVPKTGADCPPVAGWLLCGVSTACLCLLSLRGKKVKIG